MEGIAKLQHYVPQFILRNFASETEQLSVFDKKTDKSFKSKTRNVAGENRFYDYEVEGGIATLEPGLAELEGKASAIFHKILVVDSVAILTEPDRAVLANFLAVQMTRTRSQRESMREFPTMMRAAFLKKEKTAENLKHIEEWFQAPSENELKAQTTQIVSEAPEKFALHFLNKVWTLFATEKSDPFIIGDNPLTLQNHTDTGPFGNLGLAVLGIEIHFPISPVRALVLWCPSLKEQYREGVDMYRAMLQGAPELLTPEMKAARIEENWMALDKGCPMPLHTETVKNFNSLQVKFAERFLFSSSDNFALAREMISEYPRLKSGPRAQMS